jgi:mono/diheme cytochrome c family protein
MIKVAKYLVFTIALFSTGGLLFTRSIGIEHARAVETQSGEKEDERLIAIGKQLFIKNCSGCHQEQGDKPLATGLPLNERKLTTEVIAKNVNGRLKDATEDEKHGVTLYICSFMKK